jgi:hypothetical protein
MTLVIAHGQPKSGSSYLFQIAKGAAECANGERHKTTREKYLGTEMVGGVDVVTDDMLDRLTSAIPADVHYTVKTHGPLHSGVRAAIATGHITAFTSFRDPRDVCVSLLDAGKTARRQGNAKFFASLTEISQTVRPAAAGHRVMLAWADCPNVLAFPYYLTAGDRNYTVERLLRHIGLSAHTPAMLKQFGTGGTAKVWMFEKGIPDRFIDDAAPSDVAMLTRKLSAEIAATDRLNEHWMMLHGCRQMLDARRCPPR